MFRTVKFVFAGVACGYFAYIPVLFIVELVTYGRVDQERVFYGLYYPLTAIYLLMPSIWQVAPRDEIVLGSVGGALLILGGVLGYRLRIRAVDRARP